MPATKRKFAAPVGLLINSISTVDSSVASTTPSSGAFVITGGVGIGGTANITGSVNLWNSANTYYTGLRAGTLTTSTFYILPTNFPGTGTSVLQSNTSGTLSWVPMTASGSGTTSANINIVSAGTNASHPVLFTPSSSSSGSAVSSNSTLVYNPSTDILSVSGLAVTAATGSSNTTTGALVVTGGVGIGGSLNVSNKARFADEVTLTSISSNALSILGSGSVSYTWTVGTTLTSGRYNLGSDLCLVPIGGSQSAIQTFWGMQLVGNNQNVPTSYSPTVVGARDAFGVLIPNQQAASVGLAVIAHASQTADLQIWTTPSGLATTTYLAVKSNGQLYSYASIASTNTTTGALVVNGGVGIGGSLYANTSISVSSGAFGLSLQRASGASLGAIYSTNVTPSTSNYSFATDGTNLNLNSTSNIYFNISNTSRVTLSTNNLSVGISVASTNTTSGALTVTGGVGIGGSLYVGAASNIGSVSLDNGVVTGSLTGTATTSTNVRIVGAGSSSLLHSVLFTPVSSSSGSAISSDTTFSFNPSTEILSVSGLSVTSPATSTSTSTGGLIVTGGVGIGGSLFVGGQNRFSGARNSTSTTSGTVVVDGGLGITGNAFIGSSLNVAGQTLITSSLGSTNNTTGALVVTGGLGVSGQLSFVAASMGFTGITYNPTMAFIGNTSSSPITLSVLTDNSLSWEGSSGQLFAIDNNLTTGDIFSVSDISGLPIINASAGQTVSINEFGGFTRIGNGSISSTGASALGANGSLVVYGGLGITGNAFIGGTFYSTSTGFFNNSTTSTSTSTGTLIVGGGVGIGGSVYIGGQSRLSGARNATSTASGTLVIDGGIGITGNAFIGGTTNIAGQTVISSSIASTNSNSGALVVSGGVGIGQSLFVGGNLNLTGTFYSGTNTFTKNLGNGDISLDNGSSDTPSITFYWGNNKNLGIDTYWAGSGVTRFRITKELNEVGGGELWSVDRNGIVTQTAWDVGEVINTRVYNNTDLNMSATTTINSTTYTNVATITYTPKSTTSHLWIEFDAHYDFSNGTTTDDFFSRITVGGSAIVEKNQIMVGQVGGGTRSGTIFPISGRYTNTTTSGIAITVQAKWGSADDAIRVYGSTTSGYMRIQEIGR